MQPFRQFVFLRSSLEEQMVLLPWQKRLFSKLVVLALVAGGAAAVAGVVASIQFGTAAIAVADLVAYALLIVVMIVGRRRYRVGAYLFVGAVVMVGAVLLFVVGLDGASMIWLFAPMALAPLLLDEKAVYLTTAAIVTVLAVSTTLMLAGLLPWSLALVPWVTVLISYMAVSAFLVVSIRYLLGKLAGALIAERELNEKLRLASDQNERLVAEIHHRVHNSLQLVLSMLSLDRSRNTVTDVPAAYAVLERRVNAMAMVYTNLQPKDGSLVVNCRDLVDHMCRSEEELGGAGFQYAIHKSVADMEIALQLATPVALFLGEMIRQQMSGAKAAAMILAFRGSFLDDARYLTIQCRGERPDLYSDTLLNVLLLQLKATVRDDPSDHKTCEIHIPLGEMK